MVTITPELIAEGRTELKLRIAEFAQFYPGETMTYTELCTKWLARAAATKLTQWEFLVAVSEAEKEHERNTGKHVIHPDLWDMEKYLKDRQL